MNRIVRCSKGSLLLVTAMILLNTAFGQSLGEVAKSAKPARKASRVITNDNLPTAEGPANGAAITPETEAAFQERAEGSSAVAKDADVAVADAGEKPDTEKNAQRKTELREEIAFLTKQIESTNARLENESNEATRSVMQQLTVKYEERRADSQRQLNALASSETAKKQ